MKKFLITISAKLEHRLEHIEIKQDLSSSEQRKRK